MNFNIHNLVKVKLDGTNKGYLRYLSQDYSYFKTDKPIDPDIDIIVSNFTPDNSDCYVINRKYWVKKDYLFCEDRHKVVRWKVCLKDLAKKKVTVHFSGGKFGEVFLRDYILEPLIGLKLAAKGASLLHASGIAIDNKGFIFPACKGVGKTSTMLNLVGKGTFLGNDKVIVTNDGSVYSYPTFVHIFSYNLKDVPHAFRFLTLKQKAEIKTKHLMKVLSGGYVSLPLDVNPGDLWGEVGKSYPLGSLILLTKTNRSSTNVTECRDKAELIKRLAIINKYEMQYFDDLLSAYIFIYSGDDSHIESHWQIFSNNLSQALKNVACREVEIPAGYTSDTYDRIYGLLEEGSSS
jgi:hypothetical protein